MRWNKNALQQRSIFGTTLGAFGHLLISTSILSSLCFHTTTACEFYIWGISLGFYTWFFAFIWRAYRLHFLIRLNKLKARYNSFARNMDEDMSGELNPSDDKERQWFLKNNDCKPIQPSRPLKLYIVSFAALSALCCILEIFLFRFPTSRIVCKDSWGLYLMSAFTFLFIAVCAPITFWRLYQFEDSYGIRNEILVDIAAGACCFALAFVWNALYGRRSWSQNALFYKMYFAPRNWLFIFTTVAHIMSVIVPLLQLSHRWYKIHREQNTAVRTERAESYPTSRDSIQQTPSVLEHLLSKPEALDAMLELAVKDFSSENIRFYDQYMKLVDHVRQYESGRVFQMNSVTQPTPVMAAHTDADGYSHSRSVCNNEGDSMSTATKSPLSWDDLIQIPLEGELEQAFVDLYSTFIAEGSPLQVNVSYEARKVLDRTVGSTRCDENKGWKTPWETVATSMEIRVAPFSTEWEWGSQSEFPMMPSPEQRKPVQASDKVPLRLALSEKVREEVFWNIYVSVFPKYINELKKMRAHP
ncbi:hypothetical protein BX666DRAFT_1875131 [Dichotomocladium elegans]|nr:hypothetical protein BX666DRAFT_1875131 [Dichotomocladium elegans]